MTNNYVKHVFFLLPLFWLCSCSIKKYIPQDETLYTGSSVSLKAPSDTEDIKDITGELEDVIYPNANAKVLGWRLPLLVHYKAQREKPGFLNKWLNKKIGEKPVYLSDVDVQKTEELLYNRMENHGFFQTQVESSINRGKHFSSIKYEVTTDSPYKLKTYQLDSGMVLREEIEKTLGQTILDTGTRFDLAAMKIERQRIDEHLKSKGYYNFNGGFLLFEADTNQYDSKHFDLYLRLKKDVPHKSLIPYKIKSIEVYPNYSLETDSCAKDTTTIAGIDYIQCHDFFRPDLLTMYVKMDKGDYYNPSKSRLTSIRFSSIGTYKFVNIRHEEQANMDSTDTLGYIDSKILLSPLNKRAIRAELQTVMKSNSFAGPSLKVTYSNRNLFRGGELLHISANVGYEKQLSSRAGQALSSTQLGGQADLIFPRLIPFRHEKGFKYDVPKTKVTLGAEFLNRTDLYTLRTLSGSFGYLWNASRQIFHEFDPININYVQLSNTTEEFEKTLTENPILSSSFDQRFIAGLTYSFTFSQLSTPGRRTGIFLNTNLDLAGNALSLIGSEQEAGNETVLGINYAQYAKGDVDARYHWAIGTNVMVARIFAGLGIPYGNSSTLPYSKQFFAGGPYSVRAFRIRSLGPGTYEPEPDDTGAFFDRTGDIRLEGNLEYRFPLVGVLFGAVFFDAGNVWLREGDESVLPGGEFGSDWLSELGLGTGFGLRVDIQNFVIRGDLAAPVREPGKNFDFQYDAPIFNFAIGYPF